MASIDRLTEEQCRQLAGVRVGDVFLIESFLKQEESNYDDNGSDNGSDRNSEGSADGEGSEGQDGNEAGGDDDDGVTSAPDLDGEDNAAVSDHNENEVGDEDGPEETNAENTFWAALYKVQNVTKDDSGTVTDVSLCSLSYCSKPAEANSLTYQIYATEIVHGDLTSITPEQVMSIKDVLDNDTRNNYLYINCTGDDIRYAVFNSRCPAHCNDGWVSTQQEMHDMVEENITMVTEHMPVCPVCLGKDLMQEYQFLREILETTQGGMIDLGIVVEFHGRLNPRRRQLGYHFKQFDEREWGYLFDDMNSDDEGSENGNAGNTDGWGYWPEALDPSSCIVPSPASDATIAELPRKTYAEVKKADDDAECLVCKEKFTDDVVVAELPCGHFFCNEGCIEQWLKQFNNCPTCRRKMQSKEDKLNEAKMHGVADSVVDGPNGHAEDGDGNVGNGNEMEANADGIEKDGEDWVMDEPVDRMADW